MTNNQGDSPAGRFKAKVTRQMNSGTPKVTVKTKISGPPSTMAPVVAQAAPSAPKMQTVKKGGKFRFLGSMKNGGPIKKTGLYLMHAGEHVHSPFARRGS